MVNGDGVPVMALLPSLDVAMVVVSTSMEYNAGGRQDEWRVTPTATMAETTVTYSDASSI